jgi:hypothetical protein
MESFERAGNATAVADLALVSQEQVVDAETAAAFAAFNLVMSAVVPFEKAVTKAAERSLERGAMKGMAGSAELDRELEEAIAAQRSRALTGSGSGRAVGAAARVTLSANTLPRYTSKAAFMSFMRRRLLALRKAGTPSRLDALLTPTGEWRTGTVVTKSGRTIRGRFALSNPDEPLMQAGHLQSETYAKAAGKREYLALEYADDNWLSGGVVETKGAFSSKFGVLVDNEFPVELSTAKDLEKHLGWPPGTVDRLPLIEAPEF